MKKLFLLVIASTLLAGPLPSFAQERSEAVQLLSDYIKLDTTNPPGNEKLGADFLAAVFKKNDIPCQTFDTSFGRACVYARLKGTGKKKALILLNHIDVVPARNLDWQYPPFAGEIHDGELWGRGALDMKGMAIVELEAMLKVKRSGIKLDRDIIFIGTPDEEVGGVFGAKWFKEHKADLVKDAEFLVNEGYHIAANNSGKQLFWGVNVAEKSVLWLELTAHGEGGHASLPIPDSAPNRLVTALAGLVAQPEEPVVLPTVREFLQKVASRVPGDLRDVYADVDKSIADPQKCAYLMGDRMAGPMLRNTVSLTVLKSGYKTNVIPADASAELDCRLLPDVDHEKFIEHIKAKLHDPSIEVAIISWDKAPSSEKTALFEAIKAVAHDENPDVPVVPVVASWFTDSHWFRELGIVSYGWEPIEQDANHVGTVHAKNERVQIKYLNAGVERMYKLILKLGAPA